jgi:hypothetical protein
MCRTAVPMSETILPMFRQSVHQCGIDEAMRYKWIESEKAGRDLGEPALLNWVRRHWHGFLRARWLEHLEGKTFWIELDQDDYGILQREFLDSPLIGEVVARLKRGHENLDLILWAIEEGRDLGELYRILKALDINSRRIECLLSQRLSQAG